MQPNQPNEIIAGLTGLRTALLLNAEDICTVARNNGASTHYEMAELLGEAIDLISVMTAMTVMATDPAAPVHIPAPPATTATFMPSNSPAARRSISALLEEIGVPTHIRGYRYIKTALELIINTPDVINAVCKELYPVVAEIHDTKDTRVERAIRHAIELTYRDGNIDLLNKLFRFASEKHGKVPNTAFLAKLAEKCIEDWLVSDRARQAV